MPSNIRIFGIFNIISHFKMKKNWKREKFSFYCSFFFTFCAIRKQYRIRRSCSLLRTLNKRFIYITWYNQTPTHLYLLWNENWSNNTTESKENQFRSKKCKKIKKKLQQKDLFLNEGISLSLFYLLQTFMFQYFYRKIFLSFDFCLFCCCYLIFFSLGSFQSFCCFSFDFLRLYLY